MLLTFGLLPTTAAHEVAIECPDFVSNVPPKLFLPLIGQNQERTAGTIGRSVSFEPSYRIQSSQSGPIEIGQLVSGTLSNETDCAIYTFEAQSNTTFFFDADRMSSNELMWTLENSAGDQLFDTCVVCSPPLIELQSGGQFTLTIGGAPDLFQFQIWAVPEPEYFSVDVGDLIFLDQPDAGAGHIESPVATDVYTFEATAGQSLFFDTQPNIDTQAISWHLNDPSGSELFDDCLACGDKGPFDLTLTGVYTLTVGGSVNDSFGSYQFQIIDSGLPDHFEIEIGDTVGPNSPAAGAGEIETPGARDIYTFESSAVQTVFFEVLDVSLSGGAGWQLENDMGDTLFFDCLACGNPGAIELTTIGVHTITVGGQASTATGTYMFQLSEVSADDQFEIEIGDIVFDDNPGAGAGKIEAPGNRDVYTFSATPGETVFFDMQSISPTLTVGWELEDESGAEIFRDCVACGDPGRKTLTRGGRYTLTVGSKTSSGTGNYQFQIWSVPEPQEFEIAIGDTVSENSPAAGAGNIESPGVEDIYTFQGTAGQTVSLLMQDFADIGSMLWVLTDPSGGQIARECIACGGGNNLMLPETGEYTLVVGSRTNDGFGTYGFSLELIVRR